MTTRRDFLKAGALAGGSLALGGSILPESVLAGGPNSRPGAALRILILGGTGFIGPHQVHTALGRGHRVTIFNRGRTEPRIFREDFEEVDWLEGDRADDLTALEGSREWDAVLDNSATDPAWVRATTELLGSRVSRYLFVSSVGVYYPYRTPWADEGHPLHYEMEDPDNGSEEYAVQKARSERVVTEAFPERGIVVRPHYVAGPGDRSDRFTYWPVRVHRGGRFLAPGDGSDPVQFIDVRDLTAFMIRLVEVGLSGVYNAPGPAVRPYTMGELVALLRREVSQEAEPVWVDTEFLLENGVRYMVPWVAPEGPTLGMTRVDGGRAVAAGLTYRPVEVTARDTLDWFLDLPAERQADLGSGLDPEREAELLSRYTGR